MYAVHDNGDDETHVSTRDESSSAASRHGSSDRHIRRREVGGGFTHYFLPLPRSRGAGGYILNLGTYGRVFRDRVSHIFYDLAPADTYLGGRDLVVNAIALGEDDAGQVALLLHHDVGCVGASGGDVRSVQLPLVPEIFKSVDNVDGATHPRVVPALVVESVGRVRRHSDRDTVRSLSDTCLVLCGTTTTPVRRLRKDDRVR